MTGLKTTNLTLPFRTYKSAHVAGLKHILKIWDNDLQKIKKKTKKSTGESSSIDSIEWSNFGVYFPKY